MTNEEQLKACEKQIRAAQEQTASLFSHKQQIQSSLETIEAQRGNILRDYAVGDEKAEQRLDALDADEKNLRRQLAGLELHIVEKNATVARLETEVAPIQARVHSERFHREAREKVQSFDAAAPEVESCMLRLTEALAGCIVKANEAYSFCKGQAEGIDYCNTVTVRVEGFPQFITLKANNENWPLPPRGELDVARELKVIAAFPAAAAAKSRAA